MSEHIDEHTDEWFKHSSDEPDHITAHGETNSVIIIAFLLATILVVGVTSLLIIQYFKVRVSGLEGELVEDRVDQTVAQPYRERRESWEQKLTEPQWIDREKGIVGLPLDVAMQRVVSEYEGG